MSKMNNNIKRFNECNYDLYLSYHISQKRKVQKIFNFFKNSNLNVWFGNENDNFDDNLHALQFSLAFIYFPCKEYQKCIKNRIEYSIANEQGIKIINLSNNYLLNEIDENNELLKNIIKNIK